MSWMMRLALVLSLAVPFAGCGGEEENDPTENPVEPEPPEEIPVEEEDLEPTADEVPIAADFEAEAEAEITEENVEEALAELEAEIGEGEGE